MIKVIRTTFFLRRSAYRAYLNCLSHSWKFYDWKSELHCRWPRFWSCHDLCLDFDQRERNRNQFQHFTGYIRKQVIPLDNSGLLLFSESLFKSPLTFISIVFFQFKHTNVYYPWILCPGYSELHWRLLEQQRALLQAYWPKDWPGS